MRLSCAVDFLDSVFIFRNAFSVLGWAVVKLLGFCEPHHGQQQRAAHPESGISQVGSPGVFLSTVSHKQRNLEKEQGFGLGQGKSKGSQRMLAFKFKCPTIWD